MDGLFPQFNEGRLLEAYPPVTLVIDMLLRSPLALFGVNGRDGPEGWVAGVLTDCFSVNVDNWGNWKVFGTSVLRRAG